MADSSNRMTMLFAFGGGGLIATGASQTLLTTTIGRQH
jgi:hypothetical protein